MNQPAATAPSRQPSRREFLARSTAAATGLALAAGLAPARTAHAAGSDLIKIALIGCGGRGTGAAVNALENAAHPNVKLVALADAFRSRMENCLKAIKTRCGDRVGVEQRGDRAAFRLPSWPRHDVEGQGRMLWEYLYENEVE